MKGGLILAVVTSGCASLPPGRALTGVGPETRALVSGVVPPSTASDEPRDVLDTRQAVVETLEDVSSSLRRITQLLARLETNPEGLTVQIDGLFAPFVEYGARQREWLSLALGGTRRLLQLASEVEDPGLRLALLRLTGPRLEATLFGTQLLAAWVDFLQLADVVLRHCPYCGIERMALLVDGVHQRLEPVMTDLSSLQPERVEAVAGSLPELMGDLTRDYATTRTLIQEAPRRREQLLMVQQLLESLTLASAMKMALPRLPPAAPVVLGTSLLLGSDGVMMGTQVVVSAQWVERMRQLVRAGVLVAPVVGAAVRIHAGQVLMSQSRDELPKGVREALGEGPEVDAMRQRGRAGAGMTEPPRHHVLPREHREWFEQRGFKGEMDIDQFCVRMEQASHEAIHGGGNWRLGRTWPREWNQLIMKALQKAETRAGRTLKPREILNVVAEYMNEYKVPMNFTPWRGR
jgi:hypothetical protein